MGLLINSGAALVKLRRQLPFRGLDLGFALRSTAA